MNGLVKAVLLVSMVGVSVLPYQGVEAKNSLFQRLKDKTKGRASNEYTEQLDQFIKSLDSFIKKLKTLVDQTAKLQEDALPEDADFSILMPLYCLSVISEQFLSEIRVRLQELRDQYASVEGAEDRKDKQESKKKQTARTGKAISKEEAKIETAKQKMRQILDHLLWDKGSQAMIANIKCSILILLQIMEEVNSEPPLTHDSVLRNLISSAERYNDVFVTFREQLEFLLGVLLEASDHEETEGLEGRISQWIDDILIISDALNLLHQYFGGRPSNENTEVLAIQTLRANCTLSNRRRNTNSEDSQNNSDSRNDRSSADKEPNDEESPDSNSKASKKSKKNKKSKKKKKKNKESKPDQENVDPNENSINNSVTDDRSSADKEQNDEESSDSNSKASKKSKKNKKSKKKKNKKNKKSKNTTDTGSATPISSEVPAVIPISE